MMNNGFHTKQGNSYFNISSGTFDPKHALSYITYLLESIHVKYPFTKTDKNDEMDTGEDASVNTLDKTGSSGIDITSGSKKQQERGSTEAKGVWEPILAARADSGAKRVPREKRDLDSARGFGLDDNSRPNKKRNVKETSDELEIKKKLDNLNLSNKKNSLNLKLINSNCDTSSSASSSSNTCISNVDMMECDNYSEQQHSNASDDMHVDSVHSNDGHRVKIRSSNKKGSKFVIGIVFEQFKNKKWKLTSKLKTCGSNLKGMITGRGSEKKSVTDPKSN